MCNNMMVWKVHFCLTFLLQIGSSFPYLWAHLWETRQILVPHNMEHLGHVSSSFLPDHFRRIQLSLNSEHVELTMSSFHLIRGLHPSRGWWSTSNYCIDLCGKEIHELLVFVGVCWWLLVIFHATIKVTFMEEIYGNIWKYRKRRNCQTCLVDIGYCHTFKNQ